MKKNFLLKIGLFFLCYLISFQSQAQMRVVFNVQSYESQTPISGAVAKFKDINLVTNEQGVAVLELTAYQCDSLKLDYADFLLIRVIDFNKDGYKVFSRKQNLGKKSQKYFADSVLVIMKTIEDDTLTETLQTNNNVGVSSESDQDINEIPDSLAIQMGLDKIKRGDVMQTLGFCFAIAGPILEQGVALLVSQNQDINSAALYGVELATVGVGILFYCIGTKIKHKGKNYIEAGASGITFHF